MDQIYIIEGNAKDWREAIWITSEELQRHGCVTDDFYYSCIKREEEFPRGLTENCPVAIPHTTKEKVKKQAICVLRLQKAIKFHRMDDPEQEVDVNLVFNLALKDNHQHVTFIARIINLLKNPDAIRQLKELSASQLTEHLYNHIFL